MSTPEGGSKGRFFMKFNTHDRTPRPPLKKWWKITFGVVMALIYSIFVLCAVVGTVEARSPMPALVILPIPLFMTAGTALVHFDMTKAYVEIDGDRIHVVNYYFGIKKEKFFSLREIESAERTMISVSKISCKYYLQFRGANRKDLFKLYDCPETEAFFCEFIEGK